VDTEKYTVIVLRTVDLTVIFSGQPADETTTMSSSGGLTVPGTSATNSLSWKADNVLTLTVGAVGDFANYKWYLDDGEITDTSTTTGITTDGNVAAYTFKTSARKLTVGGHILTCRVTTKAGTAATTGVPDGTAYSKELIFKVVQ
jgi:hypothetical protein